MNYKDFPIIFFFLSCVIFQNCQNSASEKEAETKVEAQKETLFIGTYTRNEGHVDGKAEGILVYEMDKKTGELTYKFEKRGIVNPSYLTLHPNGHFLYAVSEVGEKNGTVAAFEIEKDSLKFLNEVSAKGAAPCHISVDKEGEYAFVSNYVGGNVAMFPIQQDGKLGTATALINHKGKGKHWRQNAPHTHFSGASPDGKFVYAVDLSLDKIFIYELDKAHAGLLQNELYAETKSEAGPRHLTFHPTQDYVYVLNELNGSIDAFNRDTLTGNLAQFQTVKTYFEKEKVEPASAAIHCHPNGKFLYASNRGTENNIAIFSISDYGELNLIDVQPTKGDAPRDFAISPDGKFLLTANQNSSTIVTFRIDEKTGLLKETEFIKDVPTPVCLKFN